MKLLEFEIYNISLINCNEIFADTISSNIIERLHQFELLDTTINHRDTRKIIYHHIIHDLCEEILNSSSNTKNVLFFNFTQLADCDLLKYFDEEDILKTISTTLKYIKSYLPIPVYICKYSLAYINHLTTIDDARGSIILNDIVKRFNKPCDTFNFSKIKNFTKKHDLTFLTNDYFNRLTTKLLMTK